MALVLKDRVKETSTTAGTGTLTLDGAASGFQSFAAVGNGNTTYYAIVDPITGDWEVGLGTYTSSGTTLSRTTVLSSSNSGSLVNFVANQKDVFVTYPSEKSVYEDASNVVNATSFGAITATSAALTTGTVSTTPTANTDIANKQYVDTISASGIHYHEPVFVESPDTAGNLNATYNNGASGVGATLTNAGTQVALTIDGVLMTTGKRVLIYNQTNAAQNGVYTVTTVGSGSTNWVLTRATDADTYSPFSPNSLGQGDAFFVTNGLTGAGETYICNTVGTITFGTTAITFAQISDSTLYTAGTGLTLTGTEFSITPTGTAGTYGSASSVPVLTTNASGQVTSVTNTTIAINGSQVSGNISGSAGSVANALTLGTYLTGTSFNGSAAVTATVDATSANTASKVVARDSSGNFSAGTITATLSGSATSATTATNLAGGAANQIAYQSGSGTTSFATAPSASNQVLSWNGSAFSWSTGTISGVPLGSNLNSLTAGTYLTGTAYNGSAAQTWTVDATSANTASKVVARDASGNFSAGTITAALSGNATTATSATSATTATNLAGGSAGTIPYQSAAGTTVQLAAGTLGYILQSNGAAAPSWVVASTAAGVNNGTLTMNVSGVGLSGSQTFTANQAGAATFTVTSNATSANTASTIVARDASGNFSAGTITATLSGSVAATAATGVQSAYQAAINTTTPGLGNYGMHFNGQTTADYASGITWNGGTGTTGAQAGIYVQGSGSYGTKMYIATTDNYAAGARTAISIDHTGLTNFVRARPTALGNTILDAGNYTTYAPTLTGTGASGTWGIAVTGNAGTATTLQTARTINGTSFNGSANITITANTTNTLTLGSYLTGTSFNGSAAVTAAVDATSANTASKVVARDASGNFSAGTITAALSGNATTSTTATNQSGGTVNATTGAFSGKITSTSGAQGVAAASALYINGGDITSARSATTGVIYLGSSGSNYLYYDGVNYQMPGGQLYVNTNLALTAANYNSYAPTLTGTGASGTWGISISGNAANITAYTVNQSVGTANNVQHNSLGIGTAASGTAGEIRATNNVTAYYSSDIKFKENVRNIPNAAATAKAIGGKLFDWKDSYIEEHGGEDGYFIVKSDFGVIAQDVLAKFPVAVRTRPDGSLAVDYEKLSALALAANAEHEDRIAKLEALVAKLIEG